MNARGKTAKREIFATKMTNLTDGKREIPFVVRFLQTRATRRLCTDDEKPKKLRGKITFRYGEKHILVLNSETSSRFLTGPFRIIVCTGTNAGPVRTNDTAGVERDRVENFLFIFFFFENSDQETDGFFDAFRRNGPLRTARDRENS